MVKLNLLFRLSRTTHARKGERIKNSKHIFAPVGRFYSQSQGQVVASSAPVANSDEETVMSCALTYPSLRCVKTRHFPRYPRFDHGLISAGSSPAPGWPAIAQNRSQSVFQEAMMENPPLTIHGLSSARIKPSNKPKLLNCIRACGLGTCAHLSIGIRARKVWKAIILLDECARKIGHLLLLRK